MGGVDYIPFRTLDSEVRFGNMGAVADSPAFLRNISLTAVVEYAALGLLLVVIGKLLLPLSGGRYNVKKC